MRRISTAALLAAAMTTGGCGGGASAEQAASLVRHFPADAAATYHVLDPARASEDSQRIFFFNVLRPAREVLDEDEIVLFGFAGLDRGKRRLALVETGQDFDAVARALARRGFRRDGDLLTSPGDPDERSYTAVARAADGTIVFGSDVELVRTAAANGAGPGTGARVVLEDTGGYWRTVDSTSVTDSQPCVVAYGKSLTAERKGRAYVIVDGTADPARVEYPSDEDVDFDEPSADGGVVKVGYEANPPAEPAEEEDPDRGIWDLRYSC